MEDYKQRLDAIINDEESAPERVYQVVNATYEEKSSKTFWRTAHASLIEESPIVAWKFCYVLHKILREGHPAGVRYCQNNWGKVMDLGKLWAEEDQPYSNLIKPYTKFLYEKIRFHERYSEFHGSLLLTPDDLKAYKAKNDALYEQLAIDLLEHFDRAMNVISEIILTLSQNRSIVACLLTPILPIIEETSRLQENCRMIFLDTPQGESHRLGVHRTRFIEHLQPLYEYYSSHITYVFFQNLMKNEGFDKNRPNIPSHVGGKNKGKEYPSTDTSFDVVNKIKNNNSLSKFDDDLIQRLSELTLAIEREVQKRDRHCADEHKTWKDLLKFSQSLQECTSELEKQATSGDKINKK